jgi:hypothetical protein
MHTYAYVICERSPNPTAAVTSLKLGSALLYRTQSATDTRVKLGRCRPSRWRRLQFRKELILRWDENSNFRIATINYWPRKNSHRIQRKGKLNKLGKNE